MAIEKRQDGLNTSGRRRWLSFSLGNLLVVTGLFALCFSLVYLRYQYQRQRQQWAAERAAASEELRNLGRSQRSWIDGFMPWYWQFTAKEDARVVEPAAAWQIQLRFRDEEQTLDHWSRQANQWPVAVDMDFIHWHPLELLRWALLIVGLSGWFISLLIAVWSLLTNKQRSLAFPAAQCMAACSLLLFVSMLTFPMFNDDAAQGLVPTPNLDRELLWVWGPIVIVPSVVLPAWLWPAPADDVRPWWRLSLRTLLLATAVCCVLLALGERGMVALLTLLVSLMIFAVVRGIVFVVDHRGMESIS